MQGDVGCLGLTKWCHELGCTIIGVRSIKILFKPIAAQFVNSFRVNFAVYFLHLIQDFLEHVYQVLLDLYILIAVYKHQFHACQPINALLFSSLMQILTKNLSLSLPRTFRTGWSSCPPGSGMAKINTRSMSLLQLKMVICHLSAVSHQPSAIGCQPPDDSRHPGQCHQQ